MNEIFTHWIVWTMATLAWCALAYRQMRISRPLAAILVGVAAFGTGVIKELTDLQWSGEEFAADVWGIGLGILLFFLLVRRRQIA